MGAQMPTETALNPIFSPPDPIMMLKRTQKVIRHYQNKEEEADFLAVNLEFGSTPMNSGAPVYLPNGKIIAINIGNLKNLSLVLFFTTTVINFLNDS